MSDKVLYSSEYSWLFHDLFLQKADTRFVQAYVPSNSGYSVMDAACGNGRTVSLLCSIPSVKVFGFDISPTAIDLASRNSSAVLWVQDLRQPPRISTQMDRIFVLNRSLNHLETFDDQRLAITNLLAALSIDGMLVLDLMNPNPDINKQQFGSRSLTRYFPVLGQLSINEKYTRDTPNQLLHVVRDLVVCGDVVSHDSYTMRWLLLEEIRKIVPDEFTLSVYGTYDFDDHSVSSPQMIVTIHR